MVTGGVPDFGVMLAEDLHRIKAKAKGDICCGGIVTHIASYMDLDLSACTMVAAAKPLGLQEMITRRILVPRGLTTLYVAMPWEQTAHQDIRWSAQFSVYDPHYW